MASRSVSYATIWCASVPWPAKVMTITSSGVEVASVRSRCQRIASTVASEISQEPRVDIEKGVLEKRVESIGVPDRAGQFGDTGGPGAC